jgi:aspartate/methionine/tyrosine aminotransferase
VIDTLAEAANRPTAHGYAPFRGLPELRAAIAHRYATVYGVELDPDSEVAVVPGTKTAIVELSLVLAERGSTVVLPDPWYPDYPSGPALAGAALETVPLDPLVGWQPDFSSAPREDVAALYLNYPSNPCAAVVRDGTFERAIEYARETDAAVVHDFAYADLLFDGREPHSFLATPGAKDVGVEMFSMSKSYGMAGWRLGFVLGNAEIVDRINLLNDHSRVGIFRPIQEAGIAALTGPQDSGRRTRSDVRTPPRPSARGRRRRLGRDVLRLVQAAGRPDERATADRAPPRSSPRRRLRPQRRRLGADLARGHGRDARGRSRAADSRALHTSLNTGVAWLEPERGRCIVCHSWEDRRALGADAGPRSR